MAIPQLPDWLPGQWRLIEYSTTYQGRTDTLTEGTGPIPMAVTLAFTQGGTTYDYAGSSIGTGRGEVVTAGDGWVRITLWPINVPSLPATIARTAQGIVVEFSLTIGGNEPCEVKAFYELTMAIPQLPDWLPGRWRLTEWSMAHSGRTDTFPAGVGPYQIALTLAFTQGDTTYDYAGGPVPLGRGEVVSAGDGRVRIRLWPTRVSAY